MFDLSFLLEDGYLRLFLDGVLTTLRLFSVSGLLALAIGVMLVIMRSSGLKALKGFVVGFVEYHRNVPILVQILIWYFGVPQALPESVKIWVNSGNTEFIFAAIALAMNSAAFISEDIRSGLRAIPRTQEEAACSIGLNFPQRYRYVILPQAIRVAIPSLLNQTLILFKNSSLAMAIGVHELLFQTKQIDNATFRTFDVFLVATILYLAGTISLMLMADRFSQQKIQKG
ncbi:polar amino acid transport system permease protein [Collimonas sp. OK607]|uniref:amino acid ABC transporter permease n=1 Tax=Collimonas sp. OK607 TaxID=1798194 RepID=UPI0008F3516C|nr:amino acid ABC transporter permease [Collimonas sp. OK607]SFA74340.1 polar amino acid transport system permease protein [Collimonas sp. OK607]